MYKYRSKQISLTDFNTPVGMKLYPDNRWVKKAELIPWDEMIIRNSESKENSDDEDKSNPPSNKGTMIVDATCAPSQIKYPQDTELLNEAREITEKI